MQDQPEAGFLVVLFWLIVGSVAAYVLYRWLTNTAQKAKLPDDPGILELSFEGERVIMKELMHGATHDVIKIDAHIHHLGVAAQYEWMRRKYRGSIKVKQSLQAINVAKSGGERVVFFDVLVIQQRSGKTKELYFDISSFFGDGYSSPQVVADSPMVEQIRDLYA
jgi:hypothetical protein